ncbi:hypothetical protein CLROS_023250 [Clostridium felsineum]|uniref:Uncharacterized protein n=1 Tax=Clostridium felsineum TaxID=36839 RepID=A0A1S8LL56_9CLOT|nr:hypothetical protein CLAUR_003600 [Clostridium felsineum]URZ06992.1 hypothetical protein CLROS_023250 [Clostridium felsineum]URZ12022.1 hypothetical protein CROST_027390 [Clostridium felsineum]URZ16557.1 hypothetical protein CLFE_026040 [Clostridium felsineum DSM 794]
MVIDMSKKQVYRAFILKNKYYVNLNDNLSDTF